MSLGPIRVFKLSSDGVTIKILVCENLKTQAKFKTKTRSRTKAETN